MALAGVLSLVSAFVQPARAAGCTSCSSSSPSAVPEAADALVALASVGLLLLARSVRRGQRHAWLICEGLLVGTAVLHLVKGVDVEEALLAAGVALYLFVNRDAFQAGRRRPVGRAGGADPAGGHGRRRRRRDRRHRDRHHAHPAARHHQRLPLPRAFLAATERLVGIRTVPLPDRLDDFFDPGHARRRPSALALAAA